MSQQINLFNPLFLRKEKYFSARTMLQSLGLIALGLAVLYAYALMQTRELESLARDYGQQLTVQRDQFVKLGSMSRSKLLEAEVARLEAGRRDRVAVIEVMQGGTFGNTDGISRYFAAFGRHAMRGVWLTGFSVGESGNELSIRGRVLHADLVPVYLKALNAEDVMRGRLVTQLKLVAKDESTSRQDVSAGAAAGPQRYVEFDLSAPLRAAGTEAAGALKARP
jgi:hypothetical protein